jgi:hypothetical protein
MKRHLQRATEAGLGHKINVAAYRHIAIAISRRWVRSSSAFTDEEAIEDGDEIADDLVYESALEMTAPRPKQGLVSTDEA